jgi:hypothetical protein
VPHHYHNLAVSKKVEPIWRSEGIRIGRSSSFPNAGGASRGCPWARTITFCIQQNGGNLPVSYKIDKNRRLVLTTWSGVLTEDEILAHQQQLVIDPDFDRSFSQVSDFTHLTAVDIDAIGPLITAILAHWHSPTTSSSVGTRR